MSVQTKSPGLAGRRQRRQRIAARVAKSAQRRAAAQQRFTEPLTGKRAGKIARSQANLEFRPLERQLKSEIRGSAKREGDLGQWYDTLAGDYASGGQLAQQAFTTAEQATNARLGEESQRAQATLGDLAAGDSAFAALVGGPKNTTGLAQAAEAAAAAERQRSTLQAPITAMRANNVASYAPRQNAARMQGIEARRDERDRRSKQQQDLRALDREKGQSTVKGIQTLREQEQANQVQRAALGTKAGYNKALEKQSELGLQGTKLTAAATIASAQAYAKAKERGASAQEAVAAANKAASKIGAEGQENTARIQGKNGAKNKGGYSVKEGESLVRQAGVNFKTPGEAVDYLVSRGVKRGKAKAAVGNVFRAAKGR